MPRYLVLDPTWLRAIGTTDTARQPAGAVIGFDGEPGVTLLPLDDEARAARLAVIKTRNRDQRDRDDLQALRFRAALGRPVQAQLDAAMAEFGRWRATQESKARRP